MVTRGSNGGAVMEVTLTYPLDCPSVGALWFVNSVTCRGN